MQNINLDQNKPSDVSKSEMVEPECTVSEVKKAFFTKYKLELKTVNRTLSDPNLVIFSNRNIRLEFRREESPL